MSFSSSAPGFVGRYNPRSSRRFEWWYDTIIDYMLANPGRPYTEIALVFQKSASHIAMIIKSDMFQARLAQRRASMMRELQSRLIDQTTGVAGKALALVSEKLETNGPRISVVDAMEVADRAMQRLGHGSAPAGVSNVNVQVLSVDREVLRDAQERLRAAEKAYSAPSSRTPEGLAKNLLSGPGQRDPSERPTDRAVFTSPPAPGD